MGFHQARVIGIAGGTARVLENRGRVAHRFRRVPASPFVSRAPRIHSRLSLAVSHRLTERLGDGGVPGSVHGAQAREQEPRSDSCVDRDSF